MMYIQNLEKLIKYQFDVYEDNMNIFEKLPIGLKCAIYNGEQTNELFLKYISNKELVKIKAVLRYFDEDDSEEDAISEGMSFAMLLFDDYTIVTLNISKENREYNSDNEGIEYSDCKVYTMFNGLQQSELTDNAINEFIEMHKYSVMDGVDLFESTLEKLHNAELSSASAEYSDGSITLNNKGEISIFDKEKEEFKYSMNCEMDAQQLKIFQGILGMVDSLEDAKFKLIHTLSISSK